MTALQSNGFVTAELLLLVTNIKLSEFPPCDTTGHDQGQSRLQETA